MAIVCIRSSEFDVTSGPTNISLPSTGEVEVQTLAVSQRKAILLVNQLVNLRDAKILANDLLADFRSKYCSISREGPGSIDEIKWPVITSFNCIRLFAASTPGYDGVDRLRITVIDDCEIDGRTVAARIQLEGKHV
jgi:hypothetical protein